MARTMEMGRTRNASAVAAAAVTIVGINVSALPVRGVVTGGRGEQEAIACTGGKARVDGIRSIHEVEMGTTLRPLCDLAS